MTAYIATGGLRVASVLHRFVDDHVAPSIGVSSLQFWARFAEIVASLSDRNRAILLKRDTLQAAIDLWFKDNPARSRTIGAYEAFLRQIAYLDPEPEHVSVTTRDVDPEIASLAGPQLVVPLSNQRFLLNALNARWVSLYDAIYGSDVVALPLPATQPYDPQRGALVAQFCNAHLDEVAPLDVGLHANVRRYVLKRTDTTTILIAELEGGETTTLRDPSQFAGCRYINCATEFLLKKNGLHIILQIDATHPAAAASKAGVRDIIVEAALSAIADCEDAVAAIDALDKVTIYDNWRRLIARTLETNVSTNGNTFVRRLNNPLEFTASDGTPLVLSGTSLLLGRIVGAHIHTDAVLDACGAAIPERFLDAFMLTACALPHRVANSQTGAIYLVAPKIHGADEATLCNDLYRLVERAFDLPLGTIKIGLMDEEKRTSLNLKACIGAVSERIAFINTGFLDRTGDEIRTEIQSGPFPVKESLKSAVWLGAYEQRNVAIGLACGLASRGQIGKGMWPKPDKLGDMFATKHAHLEAGATCAWVPSPSAAAIHALHYHRIDVHAVQQDLKLNPPRPLTDLLAPCLVDPRALTPAAIRQELENNLQGVLGYVARWVENGVGCSKIPDIHGVGLMEDRATLRISSQHVANWLTHGVVAEKAVRDATRRVAKIIDDQNANNSEHVALTTNFDTSEAVAATLDLVFNGAQAANGYTEAVLWKHRARVKSRLNHTF